MRNQFQSSPSNDSSFGIILSQEDHHRYIFLEQFHQNSKTQTKLLLQKVLTLAEKTIELQEENSQLKTKIQEEGLKKSTQNQLKKQKQKLDIQFKEISQLLVQKDSQINELTLTVQKLTQTTQKLTLKTQKLSQTIQTQQQEISNLKQELITQLIKKDNIIQSRELQYLKKNQLQQQNNHFHGLIKKFNFKLTKINKMLCEIKISRLPQILNQTKTQTQVDKTEVQIQKKVQDIYQSIIMQVDSEIKLIQDNLAQVQNHIHSIMSVDPFYANSKNQQLLQQQLSIIESQNATLHKRVSRLQHSMQSEINLQLIRKKFRQIIETQQDKMKIDQKLSQLTSEYHKTIKDEYQKAFCQLFKEEDQYHEVMEQVTKSAKINTCQFT